jgi:hypothetical protein
MDTPDRIHNCTEVPPMIEWFRCFADVPGVNYAGDPQVRRASLPERDAKPRPHTHTFDGEEIVSLTWSLKDGTTSSSPAARHGYAAGELPKDAAAEAFARLLGEVLELPGTPSDYHFAILRCTDELWKRRREEPAVLPEIERLCLLDLALVEARPAAVSHERNGKQEFFRIPAFTYLIQLYEDNGFLGDAMEVGKRAIRYQQDVDVSALQARLDLVEAEAQ